MENRMVDNFVHFDYRKLSIEQKKKIIDSIYELSAILAEKNFNKLKNENLKSIEFYKLWDNFFQDFMIWSAGLNGAIKESIAINENSNKLKFQKYCYLYQYWWVLFHLITKCYTNYHRLNIIEFEKNLLRRKDKIESRIKSNELLDNFKSENFDFLFNLDKMN